MKNYTLKACENLIEEYVNEYKGEATTVKDGILGLGQVILHGAEGMKSYIITEYPINSWVSGHKIRSYNKLPKKYNLLLETV